MQDYIPREIDINGRIENIVVKQYDNNSRYLHVTISDVDLTDGTFELTGCSTALYIKPEGSDDDSGVSFVSGEIADADEGIVTFLLPGGVTQNVGRYECEIWIYQGDETTRPVISTKPFTLVVEKSIKNDSAIVATQSMSALDAKMLDIQAVKNQMAELAALADAGEIPAGTVESEVLDARTGWDGTMGYHSADSAFRFGSTVFSSLGDALASQVAKLRDTGLIYLGTFLNSQTWDSATLNGTKTFAGLPNNIFAVCNTVEAANPISDAPVSGQMTGLIITFGRGDKNVHRNFDTQIFIPQDCDKIWVRKYFNSAWSDWSAVGGTFFQDEIDALPQYRAGINDLYASYNYLLSNVKDDGTFHVSQQDTSGGAIVQRWSDLPDNESNFIVTNSGYSTGWILQTATSTSTYTDIYRRIIPRSGATGTPSNWVKLGYLDPRLKVLAIGDSICAGVRNDGKGFVGYLGLPYKNAGVSGAALSTVRSNSNVEDIPSRFIRFVDYHNPDSTTEDAAKDGWEPDIIIANGGRNDYNFDAPLGDIPTEPSLNSDGTPDYSSLNLSTAMGGLQKLFLLMIEKYPKAQRFFVTTHKIFRTASTETDKNGYAPTRANGAGYTAAQLNDAIIACCNVYGVKVIDIFNDSMLDSAFAPYRYDANSDDNYFYSDGVHPLERGYLEGYVPLIQAALKGNTSGNVSQFVGTMQDFKSYVMGE